MIFVGLLVLTLFIAVWCVYRLWSNGWFETIIGGILGSAGAFIGIILCGAIVMALTMAFSAMGLEPRVTSQHDNDLRAVALSSEVQGQFFLGSGYIDGERVLNYIAEHEDGAASVEQVSARNAYIYEDEANDPYVTTFDWSIGAWWWAPFDWDFGNTYAFHIPEGSILEGYTIDNKEAGQ